MFFTIVLAIPTTGESSTTAPVAAPVAATVESGAGTASTAPAKPPTNWLSNPLSVLPFMGEQPAAKPVPIEDTIKQKLIHPPNPFAFEELKKVAGSSFAENAKLWDKKEYESNFQNLIKERKDRLHSYPLFHTGFDYTNLRTLKTISEEIEKIAPGISSSSLVTPEQADKIKNLLGWYSRKNWVGWSPIHTTFNLDLENPIKQAKQILVINKEAQEYMALTKFSIKFDSIFRVPGSNNANALVDSVAVNAKKAKSDIIGKIDAQSTTKLTPAIEDDALFHYINQLQDQKFKSELLTDFKVYSTVKNFNLQALKDYKPDRYRINLIKAILEDSTLKSQYENKNTLYFASLDELRSIGKSVPALEAKMNALAQERAAFLSTLSEEFKNFKLSALEKQIQHNPLWEAYKRENGLSITTIDHFIQNKPERAAILDFNAKLTLFLENEFKQGSSTLYSTLNEVLHDTKLTNQPLLNGYAAHFKVPTTPTTAPVHPNPVTQVVNEATTVERTASQALNRAETIVDSGLQAGERSTSKVVGLGIAGVLSALLVGSGIYYAINHVGFNNKSTLKLPNHYTLRAVKQ